jgi:hypothetical protein
MFSKIMQQKHVELIFPVGLTVLHKNVINSSIAKMNETQYYPFIYSFPNS